MTSTNETIIACSTPASSSSALAIIRISGDLDFNVLNNVFSIDLEKSKSRTFYNCFLQIESEVIDDICFVKFNSPYSFTGEDMLELYVHGNPVNINNIIKLFINEFGFKYAEKGDFSLRSFKNGKLSFTQIEGLDLILNSKSKHGISSGLSLLKNKRDDDFAELYNSFHKLLESFEIRIDFSDDVGDDQLIENQTVLLTRIESVLLKIQKRMKFKNLDLNYPKITLFGKPNAGKSTLFNLLLKADRSIISSTAGTTRDYVSENLEINGNFFKLIDTAGIRITENQIEKLGIERALEQLEDSFFKILLVNLTDFDVKYIEDNRDADLVIFTHNDLVNNDNHLKIVKELNINYHCLNLLNNPDLTLILDQITMKHHKIQSLNPILIERHLVIIEELLIKFDNFKSLFKHEQDLGVLTSELNILCDSVKELVGEFNVDSVLNGIFASFCIGK